MSSQDPLWSMRRNSSSATSRTPEGGRFPHLPTSLIMVMKTSGKTKRTMTTNPNAELSDPPMELFSPRTNIPWISLRAPHILPLRTFIHLSAFNIPPITIQSRLIAYSTLISSRHFLLSRHRFPTVTPVSTPRPQRRTSPPLAFATHFPLSVVHRPPPGLCDTRDRGANTIHMSYTLQTGLWAWADRVYGFGNSVFLLTG